MSYTEIEVRVESNVDQLSARSVHRLFVDLVGRVLKRGSELLRENVPKDTGAMAEHTGHTGPYSIGPEVTGEVGVRAVDVINRRFQVGTKDLFVPGEQRSAHYPLFVDRGTGVFGPAHAPLHSRRASVMRFDTPEGTFFRREVKGQRPQNFMLETYVEMRMSLPLEAQLLGRKIKLLAMDPSPVLDT